MTCRMPPRGIGYVVVVARNHVDVQVRNGLPSGGACVEPHVVAIGPMTFVDDPLDLRDEGQEVDLFFGGRIPPRGDQPPADH